jgi:hypothetical protein
MNISTIHCFDVLAASIVDKISYPRQVNNDLHVRKLPSTGPLHLRQKCLLDTMMEEKAYRLLKHVITHRNLVKATALFLAMNNLPCILHLHSRITLKVLTAVLRKPLCLFAPSEKSSDKRSFKPSSKQFRNPSTNPSAALCLL